MPIHTRLLTLAMLLATASTQAFAEQKNLEQHPYGSLNSQILRSMWATEMQALKNNPYAKFSATFDATFDVGNRRIVVSVLQGPDCDNGPNSSSAIEVPPKCPAQIAIIENGSIASLKKVENVCNPAYLPPPEGRNTVDNRTVVDYNPTDNTLTFIAIYKGSPWKPAQGVTCGQTVQLNF